MRGRLSIGSRGYPCCLQIRVNGKAPCNGDLCTAKSHLAKCCGNVAFGLVGKRIACLVRIKYFRGPLCTL